MNIRKSEMKMAVAQDIGRQFESRETALLAESHRLEGAQGALKQAAEKLESVKAFYHKEADNGSFDEANLVHVMKVVDRCRGVLISLGDLAQSQKLIKQGEAAEAKRSLDLIEKIFKSEQEKVQALLKSIDEGQLTEEDIGRSADGSTALRIIDGNSGRSAAADLAARRAAARAAKEAASQESESEPESEAAAVQEEPAQEEPAPAEEPPEAVEASAEEEAPKPKLPTPRRQVVPRRRS